MDEVLYVSDTLGAHEAARRFNRVHPGKHWDQSDMALFRVMAVDQLNFIVWEGDVWLPERGILLEEAIKLYPRWRSDLVVTFSPAKKAAAKT
ncbi:hypothetical protein ARC20_03095 [Stenotrophomonas panacihumi]|uniref:Uncharacterized protein n=1 Tax=Stenotrophomonas panacihumi TaxID=676599 RepID=A0A0R0AY23_9GAMM|nr:hypothetical protein [Stenotrophomonas panacihumi]KRG47330.1 hypothetical protein ARC20_03095 [Stenotrophomonas panacihumi]PTN55807.1 hypothetical protein C9J98_04335 [Stenotrophomonas panacihumi]